MGDTTVWTVADGKLCVSVNGGERRQFVIKGVCYSPAPFGTSSPEDPLGTANRSVWDRDLPRLRALGANAIRVYNMFADELDPGETPRACDFLDAAWNGGVDPIYALLSVWIPPEAFTTPFETGLAMARYAQISSWYVNHPAVLGVTIGSEFNTDRDDAARRADPETYWQAFKTVVDLVRDSFDGKKIISTALIERLNRCDFLQQAAAHSVGIDVWGFDIYRPANEFENAWTDYANCFSGSEHPPMLVGEFGAPASIHVADPPATEMRHGSGPQTLGAVGEYLRTAWQVIASHGIGGFVFEWSDEWWKEQDCDVTPCSDSTHDASRQRSPYFVDGGGYRDEEWFGLHAIERPGAPDELRARPAFYSLRDLWTSSRIPPAITLDLPANTNIHINGYTNTAGFGEHIIIARAGAPDLVWTGTGMQRNVAVGQHMIPASATPLQITVAMGFDRGSGNVEAAPVEMTRFDVANVHGYVVGARDGVGIVFWNTLLFIYWSEGF